jgi:hypothetical protein
MNDTNNNNQNEPEDDDAYAMRVANGNLAICFEEVSESHGGRYELFGEYEN